MDCPQCSAKNPDGAQTCEQCGASLKAAPSAPTGTGAYLPNYLAPAILVTIFCCMPLGVVALVFAAQVNGRQIAGELERARQSSASARLWSWIAFGVGIAFWTIYLIVWIVIMAVAAKSGSPWLR
jgi:hypothetical protein